MAAHLDAGPISPPGKCQAAQFTCEGFRPPMVKL